MKHAALAAVGVFLVVAQQAQAAELTGGSLDLGYSGFFDDTDVSKTSLRGQAELGFTRNFALQLDLGYYDLNALDDSGTNIALHGIYHVNETVSLGAFYGQDSLNSVDADYLGIEGGFEIGESVATEVYLAAVDDNGIDGTLFGLELSNGLNEQIDLTAGVEHATYDNDLDLTRLSLGMDYSAGGPTKFYAEIGSLNADVLGLSGSEAFFNLGIRLDFGAKRGATFGQRGLLDLIPGS